MSTWGYYGDFDVTNNTDCYDANADAHPNQQGYFTHIVEMALLTTTVVWTAVVTQPFSKVSVLVRVTVGGLRLETVR